MKMNTKQKRCSCPSGDGDLAHPCPMHGDGFYHMNGKPAAFDIDADIGQLILACEKALDFIVNGPKVFISQKLIDEQFERDVVQLLPLVKTLVQNRITVKYPYSKLVDMTFEHRNNLPAREGGYDEMDRLKISVDQLHSPACQLSIYVNTTDRQKAPIDAAAVLRQLATLTEDMQQIMTLFGFTRDDIELTSRQRMSKMPGV